MEGYRVGMSDDESQPEPAQEYYPPSARWGENTKLLVVAMSFVLVLIGIYLARNVIPVAALAGLIAFLVAPIIRISTTRLKLPRGIALLMVYTIVFLGTLAFGALLANSITASLRELNPIGLAEDLRVWLLAEVNDRGQLLVFGLTVDVSAFLDALSTPASGEDAGYVVDAEQLLNYLGAGFSGFRTVVGIVTAAVTTAILTVLVAMYLNADSSRMHDFVVTQIPSGYERDGVMMLIKQKTVWRGYLYGQLINSLITGAFVWFVLWAVGLPGAFLMGVIMVVLNMIPTFGPILAAIPGVLAALISGSTRWPELENYWFALVVVGIYLIVVQLQANVIAPRVMGTAVNLRPAVILLGLLVGFQVAGLLGSLLAVPVIASIRDIAVYIWRKLIDKDPWPDADPIPISDRPSP